MTDGKGGVGRGIKARPAAENGSEEHSDPSDEGVGHAPGTERNRGQDTQDNGTMQDNPSVEQLAERVERVERHNDALSRRQDHLADELDRLESLVERVKGVLSR
jgi:predicted RNase H-like nuclease (RuvC/YqgF family)